MKIGNLVITLCVVLGVCIGPVAGTVSAVSHSSDAVANKTVENVLPAAKSISLNNATKEELTTLPGIGPKTADAIIEYRLKNKFSSIEDITKVKGIGEKTFDKIKKYLKM